MDTKYFEAAVNEYCLKRSMHIKVGDLTMGEMSYLLRRAQELKDAADTKAQERGRANAREILQGKPQPIVAALDCEE